MTIDRREFLRRAMAISATAVSTPTLMAILSQFGCVTAERAELSDSQLDAILANALARGGDFSEAYLEEVNQLSLEMSEGKFSNAIVGITSGIGIRAVDGEKNGYAYVNGVDLALALEAASTAAFIASGSGAGQVAQPQPLQDLPLLNIEVPVESVSEPAKMDLMRRAEAAARDFSPHVKQVDITYYDHVKKRHVANSNGLRIRNELPLIWLVIEVLAEKNGVRHQGRIRISEHRGFEFFEHNDVVRAATEAAEEAVIMLDAKPSPSGTMPVVMHPGWGGVLIHEAVGHGLEGDLVFKDASIYSGKLGRKVGSPVVTLVDDSSWPYARGTTVFDDEGTLGQRNVLVENGVLVGFMHDLISAKMLGAKPTGNGRRESYRYFPIPRMTNTFLDNGNAAREDIIASTPKGIYVKALSGGSVDTVSGQFNFIVRQAYLIENGKITQPVSGVTLIGRGIDVLLNIDAVANDLELGVGICGKGQWVPVTSGIPTIRVTSGITVGGTA